MLFNISSYGIGCGRPQAVLLCGLHLLELPSAGHKAGKDFLILRGSRTNLWLDPFAEERQNPSINLVGLGQPSGCSREVSDLTRIHNCYWQTNSSKGSADRSFVTAGRLQDNPFRIGLAEQLFKLSDALRTVLKMVGLDLLRTESNCQVQVPLGYVNASACHSGKGSDERDRKCRFGPALQDANSKREADIASLGSGNGSGFKATRGDSAPAIWRSQVDPSSDQGSNELLPPKSMVT